MSTMSRVSAFAKRRRLEDDSIALPPTPSASSPAPVTKRVKAKRATIRTSETSRQSGSVSSRDEVSSGEVASGVSENSFEPLVAAKAVAFVGTREIEQIDETTCKIRLSKGQKCIVQGIARLWVRDGSVSICGAMLTESPEIHHVSSSGLDFNAEIVAQSKTAEFQLESVKSVVDGLPSPSNTPGKLGEQARNGPMSFRVLSQAQNEDFISQGATGNITTQVRSVPVRALSNAQTDDGHRRMIICGKRSADTYRVSTALVNRLLTDTDLRQGAPMSDGVVYLDLDYLSPAFTAPGTISLSVLRKPVFGPSYAQPLGLRPKASNQLIKVHYVKSVEHSEKHELDLLYMEALFASGNTLPNTPLIIRTGSWLANTPLSDISHLAKLLRPDLTICIDTTRSSSHYEVAQVINNDNPDTLIHLPVAPCPVSSLADHKLMLQSHFRLHDYAEDTPLWHQAPIPDTQQRRLVLPMSKSREHVKFLEVRGGMLRSQDIFSALYQNLVVLVAMWNTDDPVRSLLDGNEEEHDDATDEDQTGESLLALRVGTDARPLTYLGLAFVEDIDISARLLTLNTSVCKDQIQEHSVQGYEIGLVLEKPDTDGRFGRHLLFE